jgi:hypothetical protein
MMNHRNDAKTFAEYFADLDLMRIGLEAVEWSLKSANEIDVGQRAL